MVLLLFIHFCENRRKQTHAANKDIPRKLRSKQGIGKIVVSREEIGRGSSGIVVYKGTYDSCPIVVKRLVKAHHALAHKEIGNLLVFNMHPNVSVFILFGPLKISSIFV